MASDFTRRPSSLGVPTLYEIDEGTSTATYPHLVTQAGISIFQRTCIDVRIGLPEVDICNDTPHHGGAYVRHPEPFNADGTLTMACRTLLIADVQDEVRRCEFPIRKCLVWSPTSCSYVETDGAICEIDGGVALPARIAFEEARLALVPDKYPQINVADSSGITSVGCPAHATKEELVAQAVGTVMKTGRKARIIWSKSETIYAELTDAFGGPSSRIRPCVVWSVSETIDGTPGKTICDAKLSIKSPHIVVYGRNTFVLFYPDALTKEELIAKAADTVAKGYPWVCVVWSLTESIWPKV